MYFSPLQEWGAFGEMQRLLALLFDTGTIVFQSQKLCMSSRPDEKDWLDDLLNDGLLFMLHKVRHRNTR